MENLFSQTFDLNPYQYEQNIVALTLADFAEAMRNGNIHIIMSFYDEDLRIFDLMPPLAFNNKNSFEKILERSFTSYFQFPVNFSFIEPKIEISGNIAIVHSFINICGDSIHDGYINNWMRSTIGLKKYGAQWLINHEHNSVPLDSNTMKGVMNLPPEVQTETETEYF